MKKYMIAVLSAGLVLGTTGCVTDESVSDAVSEFTVTLDDGRKMPCLTYDRSITCDWSNAK